MESAYWYLALSGMLTVLLWVPYILARVYVWGLPAFIHNYPSGFPAKQPEMPLWAARAQRAHLNMVETLPAFIAVVVAVSFLGTDTYAASVGLWAQVFFIARVVHAAVYLLGVPFVRTPVYLLSWFAILAIGVHAFH